MENKQQENHRTRPEDLIYEWQKFPKERTEKMAGRKSIEQLKKMGSFQTERTHQVHTKQDGKKHTQTRAHC